LNIAIFSPSQNAYSETFIQAHKNYLKGKVFYYYGKDIINLEKGNKRINILKKLIFKLKSILKNSTPYYNNQILLESLKLNAIDVILVEYGNYAHRTINLFKKSKLPIVVHFHGYDASVYEEIKRADNYKSVFAYAKKIVVVSRVMEQKLISMGCPSDKIVYNVYGARPEFYNVNPSLKKNQFLSVGRFVDKKAPYYTILAFKNIVKHYPQAKLLLAGDGSLKECCENLVRYFNLSNNIQFLGVISAEEYQVLLSESLAFVQHSITTSDGDMEGTPLSVLEASLAGLPVISTYHAGIQDVIIHGKTGLLSKEHDVDSMANHLLMLLKDKDLAKELGQNGKQYINENVNMKKHIDILQNALETAFNKQ
jgi:glycosyltransferase involved in cell wall biosynthesis